MARSLGPDDLVLCSGTVRSAPFDVMVAVASAAGFQGISVYYDEYLAARAAGWSDADMRRLLDDHGIAVGELDGRMDWLPGDVGAPTLEEFVAAGGALGARSFTVLETKGRALGDARTSRERLGGVDAIPLDTAADAFAVVCDRAAEYGLLAHIEYYPLSGISDLGTAYEVTRRAGRPNGGVLVDFWHHLRGPDAGRLALGIPGSSIFAVQVGDVGPSPSADLGHEMMHNRLLPGAGVGALAPLVRALRAQGCTAPMGVEVYSDHLARLDPGVVARQASAALRHVLAAAGEPRPLP